MEIVLPKTFSLKDALKAQENRRIKMRWWDKKEKEMINWKYSADLFSDPTRYIPMPSLEIEDKAGKLYFEGDILEYGSSKGKPCYYVLICDPKSKQTTLKPLQNVFFSPFDIKEAKIVGNIYENPELFPNEK